MVEVPYLKGMMTRSFSASLSLLVALSANPAHAQEINTGVLADHVQTGYGAPALNGHYLNFYYADETAVLGTDAASGFALDGGALQPFTDADTTDLNFDGFAAPDAATVRASVEGKPYVATFVQDGEQASYTSQYTASFQAMPPHAFYITSATTGGTPAYWDGNGRLVLDVNSTYTLNFNTFATQPDFMSLGLYGPGVDVEREAFAVNGDAAIVTQVINAGDLVAGALYDGELLVAEADLAGESGLLQVGTASMNVSAINYQGMLTEVEILAVPEPASYALIFGALVLGFGAVRHRGRR